MLFGIAGYKRPPSDQLPSGRGFEVVRVSLDNEDSDLRWIGVSRQLPGRLDLFAMMIADIVGHLAGLSGEDPEAFGQALIARVRAWQDFMQRGDGVLSREAEVGLVGELCTLLDTIELGVPVPVALDAWQGPLDGLHDFVFHGGVVEVKTSVATAGFMAEVASLEQLDDSRVAPLFLAAVRLAVTGDGRRLPEIVEGVRAKVGTDRAADRVEIDGEMTVGYWIDIDDLPVAAENIFHDYDDSKPAHVRFLLSNGNSLALCFPERGSCVLVPETEGRIVRSPKDFRAAFDFDIAFVPILGPVEQREPLYAKEAARRALLTSGASRNFRNIWFHYPEGFEQFREMVQSTWPGMDIERPELSEDGRHLLMFCPEERLPREVCWAGYGFQVWCQMLTFIVKGAGASLLAIDEPDIYLHSDLQRQLVALLRQLGPDVLVATHSTEIISECDPGALLNVNKRNLVATRIRDASQLRQVFAALGSNLNPTLTQLAKTRRVVLVESAAAFQVLSPLARTLGMRRIANRADFAVVHADGLDARRAEDVIAGIEKTIGSSVLAAVILDRRHRSELEFREISQQLAGQGIHVHVADRYEVENYLMVPSAIQRAVERRLSDAAARSSVNKIAVPEVLPLLVGIAESMRHQVLARMVAARIEEAAHRSGARDVASVNVEVLKEFERKWADEGGKFRMVPGGELLAALNDGLDGICGIAVSDVQVAVEMRREEIPNDAVSLLKMLQALVDGEVPAEAHVRGRRIESGAGEESVLRDALRRRDATLGAHKAVDASAEWGDVSSDLPGDGRESGGGTRR